MEEDLSIIYNGKLLEVQDSLEELKELAFNTDKLEKAIKKIDENVEKAVEEDYSAFDNVDSKIFLHDSLAMTYQKSISKLTKIKDIIDREYQEYIKINAKYASLNNKIENVNSENIGEIATKGKELLISIRNSSTIDYKMEEKMVENIYHILYKVIKLELIFSGKSIISEYAKSNETEYSYFAKIVKENINELDEETKSVLKNMVIDLSIDDSSNRVYLNDDLIITIISSESYDLSKIVNAAFLKKVTAYEEIRDKYEMVESKDKDLQKKNTSLKEEKKKSQRKKIRKRIAININSLILIAGILTSGFILKDMTKHKEYKTITRTYNSETEKTKTDETYQPEAGYQLNITEYTPWIEPGYFRNKYERKVYKYDFSGIDTRYENLEEFLTPKLKNKLSSDLKSSSSEEKKEVPKDLGYTKNKYIIKEQKQDKAFYNIEDTYWAWGLTSLLAALSLGGLDYLIFTKLISKEKYSDIKYEFKKAKKNLEDNNSQVLENKKELENLLLQLISARKEAENSYYRLPAPVKEMPKIKQKVLELQDKTNS